MEKASFIAEEESSEPAVVEEHIVLALFTGSFSDPSPTAQGKKKKTCSLYELLRYAEKERSGIKNWRGGWKAEKNLHWRKRWGFGAITVRVRVLEILCNRGADWNMCPASFFCPVSSSSGGRKPSHVPFFLFNSVCVGVCVFFLWGR